MLSKYSNLNTTILKSITNKRFTTIHNKVTATNPVTTSTTNTQHTTTSAKLTITPTGLRGMPDYYGLDIIKLRYIEDRFITIAKSFNYKEIRTPIVEYINCYIHTLGNTSDIVNKEMYIFNDKKNRTICLRPEGTASIVRAVLNNDLLKVKNSSRYQKLYYIGPMYRYESPQKGRLRQFNQFGIEYIGERAEVADIQADADVIHLAVLCLKKLEIYNNCTLHLNTLGDSESRANYASVLKKYLTPKYSELSEISKTRFDRGAYLRIFDSKEVVDIKIMSEAPKLIDSLTPDAKNRFLQLCKRLELMNISYVWDQQLVRGLDYYSHTCFEFVISSESTPKSRDESVKGLTVLAGGRYDGLAESFGKKPIPSIGWAAGIERIKLVREGLNLSWPETKNKEVAIVIKRKDKGVLNEFDEKIAIRLFTILTTLGHSVLPISFSKSLSGTTLQQLNKSVENNVSGVIFIDTDNAKELDPNNNNYNSILNNGNFDGASLASALYGINSFTFKNVLNKEQFENLNWSTLSEKLLKL